MELGSATALALAHQMQRHGCHCAKGPLPAASPSASSGSGGSNLHARWEMRADAFLPSHKRVWRLRSPCRRQACMQPPVPRTAATHSKRAGSCCTPAAWAPLPPPTPRRPQGRPPPPPLRAAPRPCRTARSACRSPVPASAHSVAATHTQRSARRRSQQRSGKRWLAALVCCICTPTRLPRLHAQAPPRCSSSAPALRKCPAAVRPDRAPARVRQECRAQGRRRSDAPNAAAEALHEAQAGVAASSPARAVRRAGTQAAGRQAARRASDLPGPRPAAAHSPPGWSAPTAASASQQEGRGVMRHARRGGSMAQGGGRPGAWPVTERAPPTAKKLQVATAAVVPPTVSPGSPLTGAPRGVDKSSVICPQLQGRGQRFMGVPCPNWAAQHAQTGTMAFSRPALQPCRAVQERRHPCSHLHQLLSQDSRLPVHLVAAPCMEVLQGQKRGMQVLKQL